MILSFRNVHIKLFSCRYTKSKPSSVAQTFRSRKMKLYFTNNNTANTHNKHAESVGIASSQLTEYSKNSEME